VTRVQQLKSAFARVAGGDTSLEAVGDLAAMVVDFKQIISTANEMECRELRDLVPAMREALMLAQAARGVQRGQA
jgi:hypothetical protein